MDNIDPKPGEIWIRQDGGEARIYAVDGDGEFSIHGACYVNHGWRLESWTENGRYWVDSSSPYNLVQKHDWREGLKPIWAVLKPEFRWVAMNKDKSWWAYQGKPKSVDTVWECNDAIELPGALILPTPDCDWFETSTERPSADERT